jgi:hypothetical protein
VVLAGGAVKRKRDELARTWMWNIAGLLPGFAAGRLRSFFELEISSI